MNMKYVNIMSNSHSSSFHSATKIVRFAEGKKTDKSSVPELWTKNTYKSYPRFEQFILPSATERSGDFIDIIKRRRSIRNFVNGELVLEDFSDILFYTAGSTKFLLPKEEDKRFYPSAGARYPLEVYPFVFHVKAIPPGGYHYHIKTHSLEKVLDKLFAKQIFKYVNQEWIEQSVVVLVVTAVFGRTEIKYGNRGYRHILTEYGHMAQNLYLLSQLYNVGCCSVGGFMDDGVNRLLDIDFEDEGVIGVIALGLIS